jgi:hypothetical protein
VERLRNAVAILSSQLKLLKREPQLGKDSTLLFDENGEVKGGNEIILEISF